MTECFVVRINAILNYLARFFCGKQFFYGSLLVLKLLIDGEEVHYFVKYVVRKFIY